MIDKLTLFGLTRQEATIYISLFQNGASNGYEVAKATGISRSNVYNALAGLVEKGAAYLMEGASSKYIAVPFEEFYNNKLRAMTEAKEFLLKNLIPAKDATDGYITIDGCVHIKDKMFNMLDQAEKRIYISLPFEYLEEIKSKLEKLIDNGIKVVVITNEDFKMPGAEVYLADKKDKQIRFIIDSTYVLTGEFSESDYDTCLYSGQKNFVNVFKEALRNEIKLIELGRNNDGK